MISIPVDPSVERLTSHFYNFAPKLAPINAPFEQPLQIPPLAPLRNLFSQYPNVFFQPPAEYHIPVDTSPPRTAVYKEFRCYWGGCSEEFTTRSGLAAHVSSTHLLSHSTSANKKQRVAIPCQWKDCNLEFSTTKQLMKHLALENHIGQTPYLSKQQESFENNNSSENKRKYPCNFPGCGKFFSDCSNRKKHELTHDTNRPRFQCPEPNCTKNYGTRGDLRIHLKVHRKDKAYVCTYPNCKKAFVRSSELYSHERSHDNMLPFNCGQCGKSFRERSRLTKHEQKVHQESISNVGSPQQSPVRSPSTLADLLDPPMVQFGQN